MRGDVDAVGRISADAVRKNRGAAKLLKKLHAAERKQREMYACPRFGVSADELSGANETVSAVPISYSSSACAHAAWRWSNANSYKSGRASQNGGDDGDGGDGGDGGAAQTARVQRALLAAARRLVANLASTETATAPGTQQSDQDGDPILISSLGQDGGDVACEDELLLVAPAAPCCTNITSFEHELQRANPKWGFLRIDASVALLRAEHSFPFPLFEAAAGSAHEIHAVCYVVDGVRVFALAGKDAHAPSAPPRVIGLSVANLKRVQSRAAWMMGVCASSGT